MMRQGQSIAIVQLRACRPLGSCRSFPSCKMMLGRREGASDCNELIGYKVMPSHIVPRSLTTYLLGDSTPPLSIPRQLTHPNSTACYRIAWSQF
ncbi:Uncharacterized protein HZ326_9770 [Fusarium oxysporum f. sp. albedinis]|nr:Uncharacterized protein HZ326_9770 [Fusarium oxysporum f. sp. albedinis]